jgi:MFS transporter, AAHS family, 4-hydroxybenzoate transporter
VSTAEERPRVPIEAAIDSMPLRGLLLRAPLLCSLLLVIEGIDTYGISYIAPFLSKELGIAPEQMGVVFTATVVASMLGAVGIAPLADRIGYRKVLLISSLLIGPATLLTALASQVTVLIVLRFIIGLGFGAALPATIALISDYAPKRRRSMLVVSMSSSVVIGMVLVGAAAGLIIPTYGWRALLYVSGGMSLLCTLILWLYLPESYRFLLKRDPGSPEARQRLQRLFGNLLDPAQDVTVKEVQAKSSSSITPLQLLRPPLILKSVLLWFLMSASYSVVNFAGYWIPTIILKEGMTIQQAAIVGPGGPLLAVVAAMLVSLLMDRAGPNRVLSICYVCSTAGFLALASFTHLPLLSFALLMLALSLLSAGLSGGLVLTAGSFSPDIRATAVGWVLGLSRFIGGSAGTLAGGFIIGANWTSSSIALLISGTVAVATVALFMVIRTGTQPPRDASLSASSPAAR